MFYILSKRQENIQLAQLSESAKKAQSIRKVSVEELELVLRRRSVNPTRYTPDVIASELKLDHCNSVLTSVLTVVNVPTLELEAGKGNQVLPGVWK